MAKQDDAAAEVTPASVQTNLTPPVMPANAAQPEMYDRGFRQDPAWVDPAFLDNHARALEEQAGKHADAAKALQEQAKAAKDAAKAAAKRG